MSPDHPIAFWSWLLLPGHHSLTWLLNQKPPKPSAISVSFTSLQLSASSLLGVFADFTWRCTTLLIRGSRQALQNAYAAACLKPSDIHQGALSHTDLRLQISGCLYHVRYRSPFPFGEELLAIFHLWARSDGFGAFSWSNRDTSWLATWELRYVIRHMLT